MRRLRGHEAEKQARRSKWQNGAVLAGNHTSKQRNVNILGTFNAKIYQNYHSGLVRLKTNN